MARSRSSKLGLLLVVSLLSTLVPVGAFPAAATEGDLLITGVIQGPRNGSNPKAVELLVVNDIPSLAPYGLGSANDGSASTVREFDFPDVPASAGDYIYISLEATQFENFFGFDPDYLDTAVNINGDDAIVLFLGIEIADSFGVLGVDGTGQPWEYTNGWAYRMSGTGADGSTFVPSNWQFSGAGRPDRKHIGQRDPGPTVPDRELRGHAAEHDDHEHVNHFHDLDHVDHVNDFDHLHDVHDLDHEHDHDHHDADDHDHNARPPSLTMAT